MTERLDNSLYALHHAFFNKILGKGTCDSCAVGVIIAHSQNIQLKTHKEIHRSSIPMDAWMRLFFTDIDNQQIRQKQIYCKFQIDEALELISKTGYSEDELAQIEHAFEINTIVRSIDILERNRMENLQKGLFAVVEVLCKLDQIIDEYSIYEYKKFFIFNQLLKPVYVYPISNQSIL